MTVWCLLLSVLLTPKSAVACDGYEKEIEIEMEMEMEMEMEKKEEGKEKMMMYECV